jgi:predicted dehydrogenase
LKDETGCGKEKCRMPIRFGIAGTGWVSGEYVRSIEGHPEAELGGLYSRNPQHAEARLKEWGIQSRLYGTFDDSAATGETVRLLEVLK